MGAATKIEWAANQDGTPGATWNPLRARDRETGLTGTFCVHASDGCRNCYAETFQGRKLPGNGVGLPYTAQNLPRVEHYLDERKLAIPIRRQKPTTYFLSSMTDVFGEWVTDEQLDRLFAVMALCPRHTFIVVTKRAARMREYLTPLATGFRWMTHMREIMPPPHGQGVGLSTINGALPNVCLAVSAEDQRNAEARIPHLQATPARWRAVSIEPMIGGVDLTRIQVHARAWRDVLKGGGAITGTAACGSSEYADPAWSALDAGGVRLDWVICGGESGDGARPMHPDWARALRDQCAEAGVPFFFKQWGEWATVYDRDHDDPDWRRCSDIAHETPNGQWLNLAGGQGFHGERVVRVSRVGKHKTGRTLDLAEHNARPDFWRARR